MADFCNQCAREFDFPEGDLKGQCTKKQFEKGLGAVVICEGCGITFVDHEGNCIARDCDKKHGDRAVVHA